MDCYILISAIDKGSSAIAKVLDDTGLIKYEYIIQIVQIMGFKHIKIQILKGDALFVWGF